MVNLEYPPFANTSPRKNLQTYVQQIERLSLKPTGETITFVAKDLEQIFGPSWSQTVLRLENRFFPLPTSHGSGRKLPTKPGLGDLDVATHLGRFFQPSRWLGLFRRVPSTRTRDRARLNNSKPSTNEGLPANRNYHNRKKLQHISTMFAL